MTEVGAAGVGQSHQPNENRAAIRTGLTVGITLTTLMNGCRTELIALLFRRKNGKPEMGQGQVIPAGTG